ncbi:MAG: fatty acyl-AMP ligase [Deltaproteobacteria bacterium]|nr:fatty acyl-AMP ligase [Deltaproteobacteria bacterium]
MVQHDQHSIAHLVNSEKISLHSSNLIDMLEKGADDDELALTYLDRNNNESPKTYKDMLDGALTVATYLKNRGLKKGDKVLILLMTNELFSNSFFGTIMAGGIPVPASPPMTFGDIKKYLTNLAHIVKNCEAKFIITFPRIKKVIGSVLSADNFLRELILAKDIVSEKPSTPGFPSIDDDDPAFFQYTSGTTSLPKGVVLTHQALLSNSYGIMRGINAGPNLVGVSWLPMYHDMGLIGVLISGMYARGQLVFMLPESFVMNPVSWLKNMTKYRATATVAPNFAYHLCAQRISDEDLSSLDLSSLVITMNGAEPIDLQTLKIFEDKFKVAGFGDNVNFPVYGMAENCLAATFPQLGKRFEVEPTNRQKLETDGIATWADESDPNPYQAVSVGFPLAGQQLAIKAEDGSIVPQNRVGEIVIKSPSVMQGYYHNDIETAKVIRDGWLHTGDLGYVSKQRLFITGRAKEMIIKRGRNYYPYDIERAASNVSGVRKGCLVAFASSNSENGTEDLILVAETREVDQGKKTKIEQAIAAEILGAVGIKPDRIVLVPPRSIPKTSSGKLQRLLCRQRFNEGTLVKGLSDRWFQPVKTLVGSFIGNQRFRLRARNP